MTVGECVSALVDRKAVAFSRWGDGEWSAVLRRGGPDKSNCDGHRYFTDMGEALRGVLRSRPDYWLGMQPLATRVMGGEIRGWLAAEGLSGLTWGNTDVFIHRVQSGDWSWKTVFTGSDFVLVGPEHLTRVFGGERMIIVPNRNCWLQTAPVLDELRKRLRDGKWHAVGFCSGMPSNVWIDSIRREFPGNAYIDFGSVFDGLAGVKSRSWHGRAAQ